MSRSLLIVGSGGQGKVVLDCALETRRYDRISFMTNDLDSPRYLAGYEVLREGSVAVSDAAARYDDVFIAVGDNVGRRVLFERYLSADANIPSLVHPTAKVSRFARIGRGSVVLAGAVVNPFASIGEGCIVNTSSIVEHDCVLGDFSHISPGAKLGGFTTVGSESWIGIGATVIDHLSIASCVILGAGSVLVKDADAAGTYVGVPGRLVKPAVEPYKGMPSVGESIGTKAAAGAADLVWGGGAHKLAVLRALRGCRPDDVRRAA